MTNNDLEELIYEYGDVMKQIGKAETNDKIGMKDYNKLLSQKDKIVENFEAYFKSSKKLAKTLNLS